MNLKKTAIIFASIIILAALLVACGKSQTTTEPIQTQVNTPETVTGETASPATVPTGSVAEVPEDVPIMPEAYDLQVPNALNITYKVPAQIKDVVAYYQQELLNSGWSKTNNPDSAVGSMAQMSRSKDNGDRITFSIQYNAVGEFTIVQIYITRPPK